jgi:hypothetical protein
MKIEYLIEWKLLWTFWIPHCDVLESELEAIDRAKEIEMWGCETRVFKRTEKLVYETYE